MLVVLAVMPASVRAPAAAAEPAGGPGRLELVMPRPWQVVQRVGLEPRQAHDHAAGGARRGFANVGVDAPWLLAKSTLHPTVYQDPMGEERIRAAIDELWPRLGR